ncbi:rhamnan synthesis F family protein [Defluviimonas sp. WL0002]|uniref:Rhamnan synthesis F family protein n=1 Tax=Albidovulum marisflavi TaxID=2984159 RepID=A0ABT2ZHC6_9RHOB|nr:rhamnan synthesis F family protein [Defluviimonas sp. WL0002]MCV2870445.1 rhamnan synthesis F family protein [Defluviimonas sp. WL0002]
MTPLWKIRRELTRIWRQLVFLPMHPVEQAWFRLHPMLFPGVCRVHQGDQRPAKDIAVFLIHQPRGLQETVIATCRHLGASGYAVHLVSNARLEPHSVQRLRPLCSRIIERPNHGYDFGGYRAAILRLLEEGTTPENLLLLNDSVWFPALKGCDLLDRLRQLEADVTGPVHYRHRTARRSHLQSYMVNFSARAFQSEAFRDFWTGYAMSNNKVRTIRNGEMRLTHALREAGLGIGAVHEAHVDPDLRRLSCGDRTDLPRLAQATELASEAGFDPGRWSDGGEDRNGGSTYLLSQHPRMTFGFLGFPILKKDRTAIYRAQRAALLGPAASDLRDMMEPEVLAAVRDWDG